jgi:hypothetical protein
MGHRESNCRVQDTLDDRAARIGDLISELPQAQSLLADPQAIELHELGLVELARDPRPERVEIVWRLVGEAWGQPSPAPFRRILLRRRPGCGEIVAVGKGRRGASRSNLEGARQWVLPRRGPAPRLGRSYARGVSFSSAGNATICANAF